MLGHQFGRILNLWHSSTLLFNIMISGMCLISKLTHISLHSGLINAV